MTLAFGSYDESYPPEILRGYEAPAIVELGAPEPTELDAAALVGGDEAVLLTEQPATVSRSFTVRPGTPGSYEPEVPAKDRPRNVTELREVARVVDPAPWPAGAYVLVGTTGKRAHWSGEDWRSDESPGYGGSDS